MNTMDSMRAMIDDMARQGARLQREAVAAKLLGLLADYESRWAAVASELRLRAETAEAEMMTAQIRRPDCFDRDASLLGDDEGPFGAP
jgi:hypothetical protein